METGNKQLAYGAAYVAQPPGDRAGSVSGRGEIVRQILPAARPESAFLWWQVTRALGNSRYQMPDASESISGKQP